MDVQTLFFAIALSSGVFGVLLIALERWTPRDDRLAFMAFGFLLLSVGAWLQVARGVVPPWLSIGVGNAVALVGLSYQLWSVMAVTGRPIAQRVRVGGIVGLCALTVVAVALPAPWPTVVASAAYGGIFAAAAVALLTWDGGNRTARYLVAALFLIDAGLYVWRAAQVVTGSPTALFVSQGAPQGGLTVPVVLYAMLLLTTLTTGFGVLLFIKRQSDQSLERAMAELTATLSTLPTGVLIVREGLIERANPAVAEMVGSSPSALKGTQAQLLHADATSLDGIVSALFGGPEPGHYSGEVELLRTDGTTFWALLEAGVVGSGDRAVVAVTDISEMKRLQGELVRRADFDALTGLPSRGSFLASAQAEVKRARRSLQPLAVAVIDLDRLKDINDTGGHAAGDAALQRVAAACTETFRETDLVGRVGGDEFIAVLPDSTLAQAAAACERLLGAVRQSPLMAQDFWIDLGVSVGVVQMQPDEDLDALIARADGAMYRAKAAGGGRVTGAEAHDEDAGNPPR